MPTVMDKAFRMSVLLLKILNTIDTFKSLKILKHVHPVPTYLGIRAGILIGGNLVATFLMDMVDLRMMNEFHRSEFNQDYEW